MDGVRMIKLSLIIVSWKVKELLKNCLISVFHNPGQVPLEVIVVDNNSGDGSVEMIEKEFPQVRLIENRENMGFGRACNQGIRIARGEYLFILNPDTLVKPNTLQNIIDFMESNPQVSIGGCYLYYPDERLQNSFYRFPTVCSYFNRMFSLFRILPRNQLTQKFFWEYLNNNITGSVDVVSGGAMVLRKEKVEDIGLFDETYFMYAEEIDLCYRARQKGWVVSAIPNAKIIHHHQQSSLQNISLATFHNMRSDFLFFRKFYPRYKVILIRIIQFLGILFRLLTWIAIYLFGSGKRTMAKEKVKGYLKLLLSNFDYSKFLLR
jgi:GT2 family glycosyltransferase